MLASFSSKLLGLLRVRLLDMRRSTFLEFLFPLMSLLFSLLLLQLLPVSEVDEEDVEKEGHENVLESIVFKDGL